MKQRAHTWLALRAIALLRDEGSQSHQWFVDLIEPYAKAAAIGAWIPDLQESKKGSGNLDNHVLKMLPYPGDLRKKYVVMKKKLLDDLGSERQVSALLRQDQSLDSAWWQMAYKADPSPGQHLANRAMALTITIKDLLILGNQQIQNYLPGKVSFINDVDKNTLARQEEVATYLFMLSHFIADAGMPCHCDGRVLTNYKGLLHKQLEARWEKKIGTFFEKKDFLQNKLSAKDILAKVREVDAKFKMTFQPAIPDLDKDHDVWNEMMTIARGSFALSSVIVPPKKIPYDSTALISLEEVFAADKAPVSGEEFDRAVLHDAVLNIAMIWKHVANAFN